MPKTNPISQKPTASISRSGIPRKVLAARRLRVSNRTCSPAEDRDGQTKKVPNKANLQTRATADRRRQKRGPIRLGGERHTSGRVASRLLARAFESTARASPKRTQGARAGSVRLAIHRSPNSSVLPTSEGSSGLGAASPERRDAETLTDSEVVHSDAGIEKTDCCR